MGPRVLEERDTLPGHELTSVSQAAKKKNRHFPSAVALMLLGSHDIKLTPVSP